MQNKLTFHINNMAYTIVVDEKIEKEIRKYLEPGKNSDTRELLAAYVRLAQEYTIFKEDLEQISEKNTKTLIMKKAFSLLEIIIVILIISIVSTFLIIKTSSSIEFTNKTSVKADIAQIRSSISKENSKNILSGDDYISKLDDANINEEKSLLFSNILDKPLISTNSLKKEIGKWIKSSFTKYKIYITNEQYLEFEFTNNSFKCLSSIELCKDFE